MKDIIKRAEEFARKSHKGQKQATGKPYVDHPIKVASLLKK
jgi:(p)ppGpp synthase/HD superfamily hydrolase